MKPSCWLQYQWYENITVRDHLRPLKNELLLKLLRAVRGTENIFMKEVLLKRSCYTWTGVHGVITDKSKVTKFDIGDKVAIDPNIHCILNIAKLVKQFFVKILKSRSNT
jgi:hypothetical protein